MAYRDYYPPRGVPVEAYRASPGQHRRDDWSGGGRGGRPYSGASHGAPLHGPEIYGFTFADGLPAFEGSVGPATLAGPGTAPEAAYLALLCHEGMAAFRQEHSWAEGVTPAVETALRTMAQQCTPSKRDLDMRLQAMARLKELAQSGIHFCQGLDLEPYGSFVSGLYTPTGDLDLSIEGHATWRDEVGLIQQVTVDGMERDMKVKFLRAMASRIQARRLCAGQVERILHARVPILKFRDISGLDFDVGIGGSQALFKSTVLGLLALYDWRFGALVRLVKVWARHYGINDSANGSLNSFALTLLVVFHLQTRSPAVLPPLCQLFGREPDGERPMEEGAFPDWHLLSGACDRLSHLSRQGGASPAGGNSETLLELLSSFFALYEGLLSGGWALPKGAGADAVRGVLRRVRVDTWGGRLRYQRWDREGYCCSVEDPFDSTDNCARTVRTEEKLGSIAEAVAAGRSLLLGLEHPQQAQQALEQLFGHAGLHPRLLRDLLLSNGRAPAVQLVHPVDLIIPPRIQGYTEGRLPATVCVDHQRPRGAGGQPSGLEGLANQLELLSLSQPQQQQQRPAPPPGLRPAATAPPAVPGLAPIAAVPGSRAVPLAQQQPPAVVISLQRLRQAMDPEVAEEAARLAELDRIAAEAAEKRNAARDDRKAAKKAVAAAKAEERRRERAERGRQRSRSLSQGDGSQGGGSQGGAQDGKSRRRSRSRSRVLSPAVHEAKAAAAAAVSNLGRPSSLSGDAGGSGEVGQSSAVTTAGAAARADAGAVACAEAPLHAQAGASQPALDQADGPAAAASAQVVAAEADAAEREPAAGPGEGGKERRFGRTMKAAAGQRKEQRAGRGGGTSAATAAAAGPPPPGFPAAPQHQHRQQQPPPPPPRQQQATGGARPQAAAGGAAPSGQQRPNQGPNGESRHSGRSRGRGRGRGGQWRAEGDAVPDAGRMTVIRVPRQSGGRSGGAGGTACAQQS